MNIDTKILEEFFNFKEQYVEKYKELGLEEYELIPNEFYHIGDYQIKIDLLSQALTENKRIEELDAFIEMHIANLQKTIQDNLAISVEEANQKLKM